MIEAIYNLGRELLKEDKTPWFYEKPEAQRVLILKFENGEFKGIDENKNISEIWQKLLYKRVRASRRCNSSSPTFYLNTSEPLKSLSCLKSIFNWLSKYGYETPINLEEEKLLEKLNEKVQNLNKKEKVLLTVEIDGKLPGEIEDLVEAFKRGYVEDLGYKDGTCSLCGRETKVSGRKSPFSFYTIDKPGYISGFQERFHYRGFPICFDCFRALERAKSFLEKKTFNLAKGTPKYLIVPSLIVSQEGHLEVSKILEIENLKRKVSLSSEQEARLSDTEDDILDYLKELEDALTFHFLFIKKSNAQEQIKLHIQDVFPSRLRELFRVKSKVEKLIDLKREFTFSTISQFFYDKNSKSKSVKKEFLEIVDRVFRKSPVSESLLISNLLNGIREEYLRELSREGGNLTWKVREALASFLFVKEATENSLEETMEENKTLKEFVDSLPIFNPKNPEEKAIFLLGTLTQKLLEKQYSERKSKPFLKKLSSFKLNQRGFEKLVGEVIEKLENYNAFTSFESKIHQLMSSYFAKSKPKWGINEERMNFLFTVGMGLKNEVYEAVEKELKRIKGGKDDKE